jgi:hypothetical protein
MRFSQKSISLGKDFVRSSGGRWLVTPFGEAKFFDAPFLSDARFSLKNERGHRQDT